MQQHVVEVMQSFAGVGSGPVAAAIKAVDDGCERWDGLATVEDLLRVDAVEGIGHVLEDDDVVGVGTEVVVEVVSDRLAAARLAAEVARRELCLHLVTEKAPGQASREAHEELEHANGARLARRLTERRVARD